MRTAVCQGVAPAPSEASAQVLGHAGERVLGDRVDDRDDREAHHEADDQRVALHVGAEDRCRAGRAEAERQRPRPSASAQQAATARRPGSAPGRRRRAARHGSSAPSARAATGASQVGHREPRPRPAPAAGAGSSSRRAPLPTLARRARPSRSPPKSSATRRTARPRAPAGTLTPTGTAVMTAKRGQPARRRVSSRGRSCQRSAPSSSVKGMRHERARACRAATRPARTARSPAPRGSPARRSAGWPSSRSSA